MVSSKKGPSSGSGLSKMASVSSTPPRSKPSRANSAPGIKSSTRIDCGAEPGRQTSGDRTRAATRVKAAAHESASSARMTPRLPDTRVAHGGSDQRRVRIAAEDLESRREQAGGRKPLPGAPLVARRAHGLDRI